jgi:hypothetical protein
MTRSRSPAESADAYLRLADHQRHPGGRQRAAPGRS